MKKTKKTAFLVLIGVLVLALIVFLNKTSGRDYFSNTLFQKLVVDNILVEDGKYNLIVFYEPGNKNCEKVEKDIKNYAMNTSSIYFVNTKEQKDKISSYDWKKHYETYDKEIGKVVNDKIVYNQGESAEKYTKTKEKNSFGKTNVYKIIKADDDYIKDNPKAKKGYVYASLQTPNIDYSKFTGKDKMTIPGVPTILVVEDHKIKECYYGVNEVKNAIKEYKKIRHFE